MSSVRDIIIIAVLLFAVGISITFAVMIGHDVNSNLLSQPSLNNSAEAVSVIQHSDAALNMTDYMYLACFIGFFIAILITGYFVGGIPIVAPIYFFVVVIFTFVSLILQGVWGDIGGSALIIAATLNLPITNFILTHLGYLMAIFGLVGILAMFAKPREGI